MMTSIPHPRLSSTLRQLSTSTDHRARCAERPPRLLVRGVHEFNEREFFECHETLEVLWRSEPHPVRFLYQGILHLAVGYYHLLRGNHHGAVTKLGTGCELLEFFTPRCQSVDVAPLIASAARTRVRLLELGSEGMSAYDQTEIPVIGLVGPSPPPHSGPLPRLPEPAWRATAAREEDRS